MSRDTNLKISVESKPKENENFREAAWVTSSSGCSVLSPDDTNQQLVPSRQHSTTVQKGTEAPGCFPSLQAVEAEMEPNAVVMGSLTPQ